MVRPIKFISGISLLAALSACANQALEGDLRRVQTNLNDLRGFQAEQTTKIASLETEVRQLSGRLEELEFAQNKRLGSDLTDLKRDLTDLKRRVPPPPIVPAAVLENDERSASRMPPEISPIFSEAFQNLREGRFSDAESHLREALELSRGTEWAADSLFWLGVAQEGGNNNKDALQSYYAVAKEFPKGKKAALALLRQASVLVRLGDSKTARLTLNKLISDFPRTEEAARAKERLKDLS
jgi:TolA-binding protein